MHVLSHTESLVAYWLILINSCIHLYLLAVYGSQKNCMGVSQFEV